LARANDDRAVIPDREAKSLSTETTFHDDIADRQVLRALLLDLLEHLAGRLRQEGLRARTIELKIRSSEFHTWTRSRTFPEPTNLTDVLWQSAAELFERSLTEEMLPVRLLGVGASRFARDGALQGDLFDTGLRERRSALDRTIDTIRGQFGKEAIQRGNRMDGSAVKSEGEREP
jgi:DNA polymerase IV